MIKLQSLLEHSIGFRVLSRSRHRKTRNTRYQARLMAIPGLKSRHDGTSHFLRPLSKAGFVIRFPSFIFSCALLPNVRWRFLMTNARQFSLHARDAFRMHQRMVYKRQEVKIKFSRTKIAKAMTMTNKTIRIFPPSPRELPRFIRHQKSSLVYILHNRSCHGLSFHDWHSFLTKVCRLFCILFSTMRYTFALCGCGVGTLPRSGWLMRICSRAYSSSIRP